MNQHQELAAIADVLEGYFDGLFHADSARLAKVFHPDARYVNTVEGDYMNYSMAEYFAIVDKRQSAASEGKRRQDQILSIEFGSPRMAFAKVTMTMMGRDYLDFLTLSRDNNGWRIITKVFTYTVRGEAG